MHYPSFSDFLQDLGGYTDLLLVTDGVVMLYDLIPCGGDDHFTGTSLMHLSMLSPTTPFPGLLGDFDLKLCPTSGAFDCSKF